VALAFLAYALLLTAAVSLLGRWLASIWPGVLGGSGWQLAAIIAALLHLLLACLLFNKLKRKPVPRLFEFTRAEFRKDREWLKPTQNPPGSESDSSP
ncbi:MAG: hypothetical protein GWO24_00260, partial [Akkermansiaceae bacterium]|nr:hypothetical protein [Akkermansiaceae bacterium]